jgi:hypothetical protein
VSEEKKTEEEAAVYTKVGEDWDWNTIQDVWTRLSSVQDYYKRQDVELQWVARGSLFSTIQLFLLECSGDLGLAKANLVDMIQLCINYVANNLMAAMEHAWTQGELEGQKVSPQEKATLKSNIETMKEGMELSEHKPITPEELEQVLQAQDHISVAADEAHTKFGPEAVIRALGVILAQSELFANQGDVSSAKAAVLENLHEMWPVAITNAQKLIESASDQLKEGPAETRPN